MKAVTVARWEFIHRIKSKWFLFSAIILPVIIIGFAVLPTLLMQEETEAKTFALIDETDWVGERLISQMTEEYTLKDGRPQYHWIPLQGSRAQQQFDTADSLLADDIISGYLYIPESILDDREAEYYGRKVSNFLDLQKIEKQISSIVEYHKMEEEGFDPRVIEELTRDVNVETFEVRGGEATESSEIMAFAGPYFYIMMFFFAVFMSSQILMRSVMEERQNRVVEILISSVTPGNLMTGKILGLGLLGIVQVAIYMTLAGIVANYYGVELITGTGLIGFIAYFIPGFLLFAGFYSAVGSLFTSEQEAQNISGLMSFVAVAPIVFLPFAMNNPNSTVIQILSFIPPITPFFMILRMNIAVLPVWEYLVSFSILSLFTVGVIWASGKIFSTAILMYGKRPTLPELFRWIRAG